jgi:hypothetical protein
MSNDDAIVSCVTLTGSEYVAMLAQAAELAKEITSLLNRLADERTENMRLREALSADTQTLRLHLGEMTAQEMRTLKAGFSWVLSRAALNAQPAPSESHLAPDHQAAMHGALRRSVSVVQPAPSGWRPDELIMAANAIIDFYNGPVEAKRPDIFQRLMQRLANALPPAPGKEDR